ncbi:MAG: type II toxin-antitoxin system VapC family toxin [Pseudomonadota bacterium]
MNARLLDTNAFAMAAYDDARLTLAAQEAIDFSQHLAVCAISFYEIAQKVRLGKWPEMAPLIEGLVEATAKTRVEILSPDATTYRRAGTLAWNNRDPFDRIIAATALEMGMELVSSDAAFAPLDIRRIWD